MSRTGNPGARPSRLVVGFLVAVAVAALAAGAVAIVGTGSDAGEPDRGERSVAEPTLDAASGASAGTVDADTAALALVGDAVAWDAATPKPSTAAPSGRARDPDAERACPFELVALDVPIGARQAVITIDGADRKAVLSVGQHDLGRCGDLTAWLADPAHASGARHLEVAEGTTVRCGDFGAGSYAIATTKEPAWSPQAPDATIDELYRNRPDRCLEPARPGIPGRSEPTPSPVWQVLDAADAIGRLGWCVGCDLSGQELEGLKAGGTDGTTIGSSTFDGATLTDVDLGGPDSELGGLGTVVGVSFRGATLRNVQLGTIGELLDFSPADDGTVSTLDRVVLPFEVADTSFDRARLRDVTLPHGTECATFRGAVVLPSLGVDLTKVEEWDPSEDRTPAPGWSCAKPLDGAVLDAGMLRHAAANLGSTQRQVDLRGARLYQDPARPADLSGLVLRGADLTGVRLVGARASLANADLSGAHLGQASFAHQDLSGAKLEGADLTRATFTDAWMPGAQLAKATITQADFARANLAGATLSGVVNPSASASTRPLFTRVVAPKATFDQAPGLVAADFSGAHLDSADFTGSNLTGASFEDAVASGATFAKSTPIGASFERIVCVDCTFDGAALQSGARPTSFKQAYLYGVSMGNLQGFTGADLSGLVGATPTQAPRWTDPLTDWEPATVRTPAMPNFADDRNTRDVATCPSGDRPDADAGSGSGCGPYLGAPPLDAPACRSAGAYRCPASTKVAWAGFADGQQPVLSVRQAGSSSWLIALADGTVVVADAGGRSAPFRAVPDKPTALAAAPDGSFYLADTQQVRRITIDANARTAKVEQFAGEGATGPAGDDGPARDARFESIMGLAVDQLGQVYISDRIAHRIRVVDRRGIVRTWAGTGTAGVSPDGTPRLQAMLDEPHGMAFDRSGALYVADPLRHRVLRIAADGKVSTFAGTGTAGYDPSIGTGADAGAGRPHGKMIKATRTPFDSPMDVVVADTMSGDADANVQPTTVYVADTGNRVIRPINSLGVVLEPLAGVPKGAAVPDGAVTFDSLVNLSIDPTSTAIMATDAGAGTVYRVSLP